VNTNCTNLSTTEKRAWTLIGFNQESERKNKMPTAIVSLSLLVTLDVPKELAGKVTREDLVNMAHASCSVCTSGLGIQVTVENVGQEEKDGQPVFADVLVERDICRDPEIEFEEDGFTLAETAQC
jgi:hypothetical protein